MAEILSDDRHYKSIADKVRAVKGVTDTYLPSELPAAVLSLGNTQSPLLTAPNAVFYDVDDMPILRGDKLCGGLYAFMDITSIDLSKYDVIPKGLCDRCTSLRQVMFSPTLTHILDYAFCQCWELKPQFPDTLAYIGAHAFEDIGWNAGDVNLSFPESLKYIGERAFLYADIKSIQFKEGLEEIATSAFWNNTFGQSTIVFPASLRILGDGAFGACYDCTTITFKGTPESIHEKAFTSSTDIKTINVPWSEGEVAGAPWGATKATINYNVTT